LSEADALHREKKERHIERDPCCPLFASIQCGGSSMVMTDHRD